MSPLLQVLLLVLLVLVANLVSGVVQRLGIPGAKVCHVAPCDCGVPDCEELRDLKLGELGVVILSRWLAFAVVMVGTWVIVGGNTGFLGAVLQ